MTNQSKHASATNYEVLPFPKGIPLPHEARDWGHSIESALAKEDLTDVARGRITAGLFAKPWSDAACAEPPTLPEAASYSDQCRHRSSLVDVERRRSENIRIEEQRKDWWLKHNNKYFVLVTDSMLKSAPGLREQLCSRYHVENGY